MQTTLRFVATLLLALPLSHCATNDNPPCRRVSAEQFMRPHMFKGIPTDRFIGISPSSPGSTRSAKAFKEIWEMGFSHGWAVLWIPVDELPPDYLTTARQNPNRPARPTQ